jgi:tight adherence protein B
MFGIDVNGILSGPIVLYLMFFAIGFLIVQGITGLFGQAQMDKQLTKRLKARERSGSVQQLILDLRKERALNSDGEMSLSARWFNQLVTRSGLTYEPLKWAVISALAGVGAGAGVLYFVTHYLLATGIGLTVFLVGPFWFLSRMGKKRSAKLGEQLPDGLNVIVRSLEAGHPVPTAIALVGSEMPDPIGTEFGMMADEVAYGSSLKDGVRRLSERSFSQDIDLFAATIRLQAQTGGNLSELLKLNAAAIKGRQMLRLKVKAASAEGRMSALILTAAPFIVGAAVSFLNPDFYGSVIHRPVVQYWLAGFAGWLFIGNMMMRKMIAFKI